MKLYPINLDVAGKSCLVIGGGKVALRKVRGLLEAGALVKVIAPEICADIEELHKRAEISLIREKFSTEMLGDEIILIAATNNVEVNRQACEAAQARKILVNIVNDSCGNFNVPSKILRGELMLTISTGGNSPAFARFIRRMLEAELGENFGAGLEIISARRRELKKILPDPNAREIFWRKFLNHEVRELLKRGELCELEAKINHALESFGLESYDDAD